MPRGHGELYSQSSGGGPIKLPCAVHTDIKNKAEEVGQACAEGACMCGRCLREKTYVHKDTVVGVLYVTEGKAQF